MEDWFPTINHKVLCFFCRKILNNLCLVPVFSYQKFTCKKNITMIRYITYCWQKNYNLWTFLHQTVFDTVRIILNYQFSSVIQVRVLSSWDNLIVCSVLYNKHSKICMEKNNTFIIRQAQKHFRQYT